MKNFAKIKKRDFDGIPYVLSEDLNNLTQKESEKFHHYFGIRTGVIVPANDASHGLPEDQFGMYWWDFESVVESIKNAKRRKKTLG